MSEDPNVPAEPSEPVDAELADLEARYGVPASRSRDQLVLHPSREQLLGVAQALLDNGFRQCLDVCAADYLTAETPRRLPEGVAPGRYEVVAQFLNHLDRVRVRTRVQLPADDPSCPSLFDLYVGAENPEREAFDLFGIDFVGHPDMTRILLPETWEGHPLRKDYAMGRIPVQFKATDAADRASA